MDYYIKIPTTNKAKRDIDDIVERLGYVNLARNSYGQGGAGRFLTKFFAVARILKAMRKGDVLFLQYPMKKFYKLASTFAHWKGARVVTVIHDLGAFRRHKLTPAQENRRLSKTDFLIVHNPTMRQYLLDHGYKGGLHCLQVFDYLSPAKPAAYPTPHAPWRVVYAGNLGHRRNEFLYRMEGVIGQWRFDLYGKGFDVESNRCRQVVYHGFIDSDDFIGHIEADFGLVWDGDSVDECTGPWGEYLRINDPHKTSFYLRAALPVIVWKQAAMAPFVLGMGVGIAVESLRDIERALSALTPAAYTVLKANATALGQQLAEGHYVTEGLRAAHEYLSR